MIRESPRASSLTMGSVRIHQKLEMPFVGCRFRADEHRPKLEAHEFPPQIADPFLLEQHRPFGNQCE